MSPRVCIGGVLMYVGLIAFFQMNLPLFTSPFVFCVAFLLDEEECAKDSKIRKYKDLCTKYNTNEETVD